MGTWGHVNLDSDYARDELGERVHELVGSLMARARGAQSRECDELDYTALFVEFEVLFALDDKQLVSIDTLPAPEEVEQLKADYLRDWDTHIDDVNPTAEHKLKRRGCIVQTFDRFRQICAREAERLRSQAEDPEWVETEPPTLGELTGGERAGPHAVLGDYEISLPESWTLYTDDGLKRLPPDLLFHRFLQEAVFHAKAEVLEETPSGAMPGELLDQPCQIDRLAFMTVKPSSSAQVGPPVEPYLLLALMQPTGPSDGGVPNEYNLAFGAEAFLMPHYAEVGWHVGSLAGDEPECEIDLLGVSSFRPLPGGGDTPELYQSLFFHRAADDRLLVLEYGHLGDFEDDAPNAVLVRHLADSLRRAR